MENEKQARRDFTCTKCFKALQLQQHVYKKAYERHDTCLSCRTVDITDNVLTEGRLNQLLMYAKDEDNGEIIELIASHRALNSRNAKLVHENDELMAENEMRKKYESFLRSVIRCNSDLADDYNFERFKQDIRPLEKLHWRN